DGQRDEHVEVETFTSAEEVTEAGGRIGKRLDQAVRNGAELIARVTHLFPRLRLGDDARTPISKLTGSQPVFRQLVRHLRALDEGARTWTTGAYAPVAVTFSVESEATLNHGTYGQQREFRAPEGFALGERWSLHTKLTG